jgi:hypothetical protein
MSDVNPWAAPDRAPQAPAAVAPRGGPGRPVIFPGTAPAAQAGPSAGFARPQPPGPQPPGRQPGFPGAPAGFSAAPTAGYPQYRPSGLFPAPSRPVYREPFPAGGAAIAVGVLAGTVWMALLGVLGTSARSYVWWTVAAGVLGLLGALLLARLGDRGVAVGAALACAIGVAIGFLVVAVHWANDGYWLLW